jgi:GWxTD domain-containing protein
MALTLGVTAGLAQAAPKVEKPDKDDKRWLDQVEALILPEEQQVFKSIPKADRADFQTIFWIRRNPRGWEAQTNEFKEQFERAAAEVEKKFKVVGRAGTATDCGRVYLLFGPPDQVRATRDAGRADDPMQAMGRAPEIWTYKDRPGFTFPGGKIEIGFDGACALPVGSPLREHLRKVAANKAAPGFRPEIGPDGRLVKLDVLIKRFLSPSQLLMREPRQDFAFEIQPKLSMRGQEGTYIAGLLRVPAAGLKVVEEAGKKKVTVVVPVQLVNESGRVVGATEREKTAEVAADGTFQVSYAASGDAGQYTVRVGVFDPASQKASLQETLVELPDFASAGLKLTDLNVLGAIDENITTVDPKDPLADFLMGSMRLRPRFGNIFKKSDSPQFLCLGYNATPDPATGVPSVTARFEVYQGEKKIMASQDQRHDTVIFSPNVGPVPLASMEAGQYRVKLIVTDNVAKKEYTRGATYEVRP